MKKKTFKIEVTKLSVAVGKHVTAHGAALSEGIYQAALPILLWIEHLTHSELTNTCDEMLSGVRSGIVEAVGCAALGLVRPAIFALRGQVDMALSWLYFKDHPVEWQHLVETGEGFFLKGKAIEYLSEYFQKFSARYALLLANKTRQEPDPYRVLSAHIHSQSTMVIPSHAHLSNLVSPITKCNGIVDLQGEVAEYLNDILLACYADKWASLPEPLVETARTRLSSDAQAKLFG